MALWKEIKAAATKHLATCLVALPSILLSTLAVLPEKYLPVEIAAQITPAQWLRTVLLLLAMCVAAIAYAIYVHPKFIFIKEIGAWKNIKFNVFYCTKCMADDKQSPMLESPDGWRCKTCTQWYKNPDYNPPPSKKPKRVLRI
jgi:hypothetical protein